MEKTLDIIEVLTAKSAETMLRDGGTQSWVLDRAHALRCRYVVLFQNAYTDWGDGKEPHGTAFMVGRIADVVPSTVTEGRWLVKFDKYALIHMLGLWQGLRDPVHYTNAAELAKLGLNFEELDFQPMPEAPASPATQAAEWSKEKIEKGPKLTIAEAKEGLAATFGVPPEAIEITIRG